MLQTSTQGQMKSTAMLKVWILENFPSQAANHYASYTAITVSVRPLNSSVEPGDQLSP
jgi:type IV secretory pathway TrbL component